MSDKSQTPTGVFVRLPLSEDRAHVFLKESSHTWDEYNGASDALACEAGLIAIGTPVAGGEFYPVGYIAEEAIGGLAAGIYQSASIFRDEDKEHHDIVALVRLEYAQSALAAAQAEIVRLRAENEREDKAHTQTITERDTAEEIIAEMYQAVMGEPPEWRSSFGFRDAIDDIVDYVRALREHPFQKFPQIHLNNIATLTERARKNISIAHGGRKMARTISPILDEIDAEITSLKGPEA
ncbi:hypothetical protein [Acetobacter malorum]|uniref:hypothetical protein n=1 Tax=Acetobacter malorum TaxID=178901 RepID=UPI000A386C80|nr:hypothetical protein [Acetobacter malorum]